MITPADASEILTIAAAFDRRTIGKTDAIAWADALHDLDPRDCADAVRAHFRESTEYLMPVHVRNGVKAIRAERVRNTNSALLEPHDVDYNDLETYQAARRRLIERAANGETLTAEPLAISHTDDVTKLLEKTIASLPKIPPAKPQADLAKKRVTDQEAVL